MTCATCHGRKVIRRAVRDATPHATFIANRGHALTSISRQVEVPCPDCQPRPFAEVVRREHPATPGAAWDLFVAGENPFRIALATDAEGFAARVNAAVEARETKLRERISAAENVVQAAIRRVRAREGRSRDWVEDLIALSDLLAGPNPSVVSGDVACGLAFFLGAAQSKVEGTWAVLADLANQRDLTGNAAKALLSAVGLEEVQERDFLRYVSDGDLNAEMRRRGWLAEALVDGRCHSDACRTPADPGQRYCAMHRRVLLGEWTDPPLTAPASLENLPSELRPGQLFGEEPVTGVRIGNPLPPIEWRRINQGVPVNAGAPGDSPENPMPVRPGEPPPAAARYLMPVPADGRLQWRDAAGEWHDMEGMTPPPEATHVRAVYRGRNTGTIVR